MEQIYEYELGVLLKNTDREFNAYNFKNVYGGEYAFYDDTQGAFTNVDYDLITKEVKEFLSKGFDGIYAIIKKTFKTNDDDIIAMVNDNNCLDEYDYDIHSVIWCGIKMNGKIIENFLFEKWGDEDFKKA